jgi:hypothetical protein
MKQWQRRSRGAVGILSAVSASGSLVLARMAEDRESLEAGE